ncbi:hypothetical protein GCM10010182_70780 [Actinomadura cremea]|nr:hypothetical protein GCM10010182_70780 [Actinomadura cremea]
MYACGPADAPPLVLLHGGGTTAAVWYANVAELTRRHRLYAVDRIGEPGRSIRGERPPRTVPDLLDPTQCFAGFRGGNLLRAAVPHPANRRTHVPS